jgi:hypothetical protein
VAFAQKLADQSGQGINPAVLDAAMASAAYELKDPTSALFRNVRKGTDKFSHMICGEINGKNSFGAYAGYSPFYYSSTTKNSTVLSSDEIPELRKLKNLPMEWAGCTTPDGLFIRE